MKIKFSQSQFINLLNDLLTASHQVHQENINNSITYEDYQTLVKDKLKILNSMK